MSFAVRKFSTPKCWMKHRSGTRGRCGPNDACFLGQDLLGAVFVICMQFYTYLLQDVSNFAGRLPTIAMYLYRSKKHLEKVELLREVLEADEELEAEVGQSESAAHTTGPDDLTGQEAGLKAELSNNEGATAPAKSAGEPAPVSPELAAQALQEDPQDLRPQDPPGKTSCNGSHAPASTASEDRKSVEGQSAISRSDSSDDDDDDDDDDAADGDDMLAMLHQMQKARQQDSSEEEVEADAANEMMQRPEGGGVEGDMPPRESSSNGTDEIADSLAGIGLEDRQQGNAKDLP